MKNKRTVCHKISKQLSKNFIIFPCPLDGEPTTEGSHGSFCFTTNESFSIKGCSLPIFYKYYQRVSYRSCEASQSFNFFPLLFLTIN